MKISVGPLHTVGHEITAYDALSVTARYHDFKTKTPFVTFPLVRGAPYLTAHFKAGVLPSLTFPHAYLTGATGNADNKKSTPGVVTGTQFVLTLNGTLQTWVLYTEHEMSFKWDAISFRGMALPRVDWTLRCVCLHPPCEACRRRRGWHVKGQKHHL